MERGRQSRETIPLCCDCSLGFEVSNSEMFAEQTSYLVSRGLGKYEYI